MDTLELLKFAIANKKQVIANYNGYHREMCPHALGYKNDEIHCLFYQFGGDSKSGTIIQGSPNNWRCIRINGLLDIELKDGEWFTASNHQKPSTCIDNFIIEVEY